MKLNDYVLSYARPIDVKPNRRFTENVMNQIEQNKPSHRLSMLFARNPLVAALYAMIVLIALSGTVYAVTQLWPQASTSVESDTNADKKTFTVSTRNCSDYALAGKYQLKSGSNLTDDQVRDSTSAACEYDAIRLWGEKNWPTNTSMVDNSTPSYISKNLSLTYTSRPRKLVSSTNDTITTSDLAGTDKITHSIASTTQIVDGRAITKLEALSPGSLIALLSNETFDLKNQSDCTSIACSHDEINKVSSLKAIVRLDHTEEDFKRMETDFVALLPCENNPLDICPVADSVYIFSRNDSDIFYGKSNWQETSGKLESFSDKSFTIKTLSGRTVTVQAEGNVIQKFNNDNVINNGFKLKQGDTIRVNYLYNENQPAPMTVEKHNVMGIELVTESNSRKQKY